MKKTKRENENAAGSKRSSISIYKTRDFDAANSAYKVKIWDKSGNMTEWMVDVSKVDPGNCDTAEMYVYTAHLK